MHLKSYLHMINYLVLINYLVFRRKKKWSKEYFKIFSCKSVDEIVNINIIVNGNEQIQNL